MSESVHKPDKKTTEQDRREFLERMAKAAGGLTLAAAAGAIGGIAERKISSEKSTEPVKSVEHVLPNNPEQELVNQRYTEFVNAVNAGDPESIELATALIVYYDDELKRNNERQANMTAKLVQSEPNSGFRGIIKNELQFLKDKQEWIIAYIDSLKDPVHNYLKSEKSNKGKWKNPDDVPEQTEKQSMDWLEQPKERGA